MILDGGQGRNRTADASLFRAGAAQCYLIDSVYLAPRFCSQNRHFIGMKLEWVLE
jgi:hypothetical protein